MHKIIILRINRGVSGREVLGFKSVGSLHQECMEHIKSVLDKYFKEK